MVMCRGRLTILSDSANLSRLGMFFPPSSSRWQLCYQRLQMSTSTVIVQLGIRWDMERGNFWNLTWRTTFASNALRGTANRYLTTGVLPKTVRTLLYLAPAALYRTERSVNFLVIYARASTDTKFAYMLFHHQRSNYPKTTKPRQNQFLHGIISSISSDRSTALLAAKPTNLDVVEVNFPIQLSIVLRRLCCRLHLPL